MTRAVVTGGAGFLGSHLCETLVDDGKQVIALDNFGSGRQQNLAGINRTTLSIEEHDIREPINLSEPVGTIYHFASRASPEEFQAHAVEIAETNAVGSRNVLELAADHDATVILASTSEVYGDPDVHPQHESYNGNVEIRGPRAPYNEAKRFMEALGSAYHSQHGVDVRTVRIFNTYGPRMRPSDGRVVPNFVTQALAGDPITVHGSGEQTRSFCYVDDLIRGIRGVAECPSLSGSVVNLGSTAEISINQLARTVLDLSETDSHIEHIDRPKDDPEVRRPEIGRAKRHLGWSPETPLRDGLVQTIDHFKRQQRAWVTS